MLNRLHEDWRRILTKAWSIRFILVSILFSGVEIILPFLEGVLPIPTGVFAGLSVLVMILALVARITVQKNMKVEV